LKTLRKEDMVSFGFSKKKLLGTLPPLLNKPMGFITKLLEKTFQRQSLAKYSQPGAAEITRCGFTGACTFLIELSINFKRRVRQIVFSISQTTQQQRKLSH